MKDGKEVAGNTPRALEAETWNAEKTVLVVKQLTISAGVLAAIFFVFTALGSVRVLTDDLRATAGSIDVVKLRLLISSTALYIGVAFAAFGFGLFLIGAQGSFKVAGGQGSLVPAFETSAPGLVVMVCATIVIYFALNVGVESTERRSVPASETKVATTPAPPKPDLSQLSKPDGGQP